MATITFLCPKCKFVCAFREKHVGLTARCLRCDGRFIIPAVDGAKAELILPPKTFDDPLPGFFEAVLKNSARAIFSRQSFTVLIFVLILTALRFFTAHLDFWVTIRSLSLFVPFGTTIKMFVLGMLFYTYAEIIYATAYDYEAFPQVSLGGFWGFLPTVFKSLYAFFMALLIVLLPCVILNIVLKATGVSADWALELLAVLGLFLFPMAIVSVAISRDLGQLLNLDNYYTPIKKALRAYLLMAGIFIFAAHLSYYLPEYGKLADKGSLFIFFGLILRLAGQIIMLFAMRAIGLFHRHYNCYFNW
ncbi:MAG: hypothetical protein K8R02_08780 [Anaerohalosphaeraceae bacterium]|nr:hypothetical protein [Anaerohalosphaeraceae bacterium]